MADFQQLKPIVGWTSIVLIAGLLGTYFIDHPVRFFVVGITCVAFVVLLFSIGLQFGFYRRSHSQNDAEKRVIKYARRMNGEITVLDAMAECDLTLSEVKEIIEELEREGLCEVIQSDNKSHNVVFQDWKK